MAPASSPTPRSPACARTASRPSTGAPARAFTVRARHTIVAAGVWTGALTDAVALRPSRGSHLLVRAERLGDPRAAVNVPVPGERGRWVFALPRSDGLVAIGLTDVPAPGEPADDPRPDAGRGGRAAAARLRRARRAARPRRRRRPLRRAAPAGRRSGGRRDRRPLAPAHDRDRRRQRRARDRRRQADDVPADGAGRGRPRDRPAVPHAPAAARRRRRAGRPCARSPRRSGSCAATAPRRPRWRRSRTAARSCSSRSPRACPRARRSCCGAMRHELALTADDLVDRRVRVGLVPEWRAAAVATAERELGTDERLAG